MDCRLYRTKVVATGRTRPFSVWIGLATEGWTEVVTHMKLFQNLLISGVAITFLFLGCTACSHSKLEPRTEPVELQLPVNEVFAVAETACTIERHLFLTLHTAWTGRP